MTISMMQSSDYSRLKKQWNREYLVQRFGIYVYQLNDAIKSTKSATIALKLKRFPIVTILRSHEFIRFIKTYVINIHLKDVILIFPPIVLLMVHILLKKKKY